MQKFIVEGGVNLSGSITPSGNKNEALPVLAAALLANKPVIIHNVPQIPVSYTHLTLPTILLV